MQWSVFTLHGMDDGVIRLAGCMEIGCDGVIIRLKTNIGNGHMHSYDARMMLHQGNMLRFTDAHVSSG